VVAKDNQKKKKKKKTCDELHAKIKRKEGEKQKGHEPSRTSNSAPPIPH